MTASAPPPRYSTCSIGVTVSGGRDLVRIGLLVTVCISIRESALQNISIQLQMLPFPGCQVS